VSGGSTSGSFTYAIVIAAAVMVIAVVVTAAATAAATVSNCAFCGRGNFHPLIPLIAEQKQTFKVFFFHFGKLQLSFIRRF